MDDDNDSLRSVLTPALVATALATLFIAGSASVIRRRRTAEPEPPLIPEVKPPIPHVELKPSARSKERRRRGKDPLKEVLKGGKKQQQQLDKLLTTTAVDSSPAVIDNAVDSIPSSGIVRPASPLPPAVPAVKVNEVSNAPAVRSRQSTAHDPWAWDGQGPSSPTRFRSKSSSRAISHQLPSIPTPTSSDDLALNKSAPTPSTSTSASIASASGSNSGRGTPPPQTQLASLRGALEAARMREEKARAELDRANRDAEALRWENGTWRRREVELQTQIHHLMHQLQTYAAFYMQQQQQQHLQVPGSGATSPNSPASPNGFSPSPFAPPSPSGYAPLFPPPMFYGYGPQSPPAPPPPQHPPQPQQADLFSMLFPNASTKSGSRGSASSASASASVSSSSGADSPDLPPLGQPMDRGRRRTRVHTADARLGGQRGGSWEEGWIGVNDDVYDDDSGEIQEDDEGFSEMLADAILKRPESIRVSSRKRKQEPTVEFTFPSLMDFGAGVHTVREVDILPELGGAEDEENNNDDNGIEMRSDQPETDSDSGEVTPSPHATTTPHPTEEVEGEPTEER